MITTTKFLLLLGNESLELNKILSKPEVRHIVQHPIDTVLLDELAIEDSKREIIRANLLRVNNMITNGDVDFLQHKLQSVDNLFQYQGHNRRDVGYANTRRISSAFV